MWHEIRRSLIHGDLKFFGLEAFRGSARSLFISYYLRVLVETFFSKQTFKGPHFFLISTSDLPRRPATARGEQRLCVHARGGARMLTRCACTLLDALPHPPWYPPAGAGARPRRAPLERERTWGSLVYHTYTTFFYHTLFFFELSERYFLPGGSLLFYLEYLHTLPLRTLFLSALCHPRPSLIEP